MGMFVSHVITRLIVGGAQENTISTVLGLHESSDVDVELISGPTDASLPEGSLDSKLSKISKHFHIEPHLIRPVSLFHDFRAYISLKRRYQETHPDIVHTHSGKAGFIGRLAAKAAGIKCIIHTIHGPSFGSYQSGLSNAFFVNAERIAGRATHHFIGVADAMCRQYQQAGIGNPSDYSTIYSGFDLNAFFSTNPNAALRAKLGILESDFVIGKIARLFDLKGHQELFSVLPRLIQKIPNLKLLLVGGGPHQELFINQLNQMGLRNRVVFSGLIKPEEVPQWVGIMDVLTHLSQREGLPRALPQAMAAGKPVVALDLDGSPEVCITGKTGFLLQPGDQRALITAMVTLFGNPDLRERLGQAGKHLVKKRFTVQTMVESIHSLYLRLLANGGNG
ncbi:glycosyltransferase family 4 protein [bacterium]|nr:glycosyltransferase family 4 protein [bacterium]